MNSPESHANHKTNFKIRTVQRHMRTTRQILRHEQSRVTCEPRDKSSDMSNPESNANHLLILTGASNIGLEPERILEGVGEGCVIIFYVTLRRNSPEGGGCDPHLPRQKVLLVRQFDRLSLTSTVECLSLSVHELCSG